MRTIQSSIILLALVFLSIGCRSKNNGQITDRELKKRSAKYVFQQMDKYHLEAEWFDGKAAIHFQAGQQKVKGNATIRMRHDSIIWIAVKKLGVEGGRILITKDSVFIINRVDKTYLAQPFDFVRNLTGLAATDDNLADFRNLYNLILGNVVLFQKGGYLSDAQPPYYVLRRSEGDLQSEYWANGSNFTLAKTIFMQGDSTQLATCRLEGYQNDGGRVFAYERHWDIQAPQGDISVKMNFSKVEWDDPARTPFSIPKKYKEVRSF